MKPGPKPSPATREEKPSELREKLAVLERAARKEGIIQCNECLQRSRTMIQGWLDSLSEDHDKLALLHGKRMKDWDYLPENFLDLSEEELLAMQEPKTRLTA